MLSTHNYRFVMMTKDGKRGKRFIFQKGTFSADNVLTEYELAYVWRDGNTAFKVLTNPDPTGLFKAEANRDLEIMGDRTLSIPFNIFLGDVVLASFLNSGSQPGIELRVGFFPGGNCYRVKQF